MSKYSYQDLETRLCRLEDMILFVMKAMKVSRTVGFLNPTVVTSDLFDLYLASRSLPPADKPTVEIIDATTVTSQPDQAL